MVSARLLVMGMMLALTGAATAETFRWVDQDGSVHFGDTPPPGVKAEPLRVAPPKSKLSAEEARQKIQNLRAQRENENAQAEAKRAEEARKQQDAIASRHTQLHLISSGLERTCHCA